MIEVSNLQVRVGGSTLLLDLSFSIFPGSFVLLVGANGAGKTTLLDHCAALKESTEGRIMIDGHPASRSPTLVRTTVGYVFEDPGHQLIGATIGEDVAFGPRNLGLPRDEIDRRVSKSLESVGMGGEEKTPIDSLSGGEQTRVALAGALAMDPPILLLDEPLTGLDFNGRKVVLETLEAQHAAGQTILLATHDLRDLGSIADRVLGLEAGKLVLDGAPGAVTQSLEDMGVRVPHNWPDP